MPSFDIKKEILDFLGTGNMINVRKEKLIEQIDKHFPEYNTHTPQVIAELMLVTENHPQHIIDITNRFLTNKGALTKIWDLSSTKGLKNVKPGEMIAVKAKALASMYEMSPLLSLLVHLLSRQKTVLQFDNNNQILTHLRILGISTRDKEDLRIIRNSVSHLSSFDSDHIILDKKKVAISRIDELYYKIDNLMNWNLSIMIYSLIYIPRFGVLVACEIFLQLDKFNNEWQSYFDGVKSFFSTELEELRKEKEIKKINESQKRVRRPAGLKISEMEIRKFLIENIDLIADGWSRHATSMANLLKELHNEIVTDDERNLLLNVSNWIRKQRNLFKEINDAYRADPEKYNLLFFPHDKLAT